MSGAWHMGATTKALVETIGDAGYAVQMAVSNRQQLVEAANERTGERFVVRARSLCDAAAELARQVGIDLGDG